ncbi:MAG: DNA-processing protein DprA [Lachnospiraceae bacterium]|nr:DNA-processing protein DprA [Lachnospiraceae bacterium]
MNNREVMFFLHSLQGIGKKTVGNLMEYFGNVQAVYHAPESELTKLLKPAQCRLFLDGREKKNPKQELMELEKKGIRYYSVFDKEYPKRLLKTADIPMGLFVKGSLPEEDVLTVSVVGTRKHSYYGEKQTKEFCKMIAGMGVPVISGMARGIDGIAQKTAITNGSKTYAVLGCGVDICYPEEHIRLYEQIPQCGGIISEYFPGTQPEAGLFPLRNRIISALGDILLVMEAREKSGTLITVDMALEQGKEIWVLPGRVDDALSVGCNRLIAQGAYILPTVKEFKEELMDLSVKYNRRSLKEFVPGKSNSEPDTEQGKKLSLLEKAVVAVLDYKPLSLTSIYESLDAESRKQYPIAQVSVALIQLCMKNLAKQAGAGYYTRS